MSIPQDIQACLQTVVIPPGGTVVLPSNATIIHKSQNAVLTSDCESVQQMIDSADTSVGCYRINWFLEYDSGGGTGPWNVNDTRIRKLGFGNNIVEVELPGNGGLNPSVLPGNNTSTSTVLVEEIKRLFPFITKAVQKVVSTTGERKEFQLALEVPSVLGSDFFMELGWHDPSASISPLRIYAQECPDCCGNTSS
jgi:hypothetical protein